MIEMKQTMAHFLLDESEPSFVFGHKKRVTAVTPAFVNLKSNTMKNTMQKYYYYLIMQYFSLFYNFS